MEHETVQSEIVTDNIIETERSLPAMISNSHILQAMLPSSNINNESYENNWTKENTETVRKWQLDTERTSLIYGEVLHNLNNKLQYSLVAILVIGAIMTLIAALNVTLSFLDLKWIAIGASIILLIGTAISTIWSGTIVILNWREKINIFTKYVEKLNGAWFMFEVELGMSADQRQNAIDFIKRADGTYMGLMQQAPYLTGGEFMYGNHKYQDNLLQEQIWSRQFKAKLNQIVVQ